MISNQQLVLVSNEANAQQRAGNSYIQFIAFTKYVQTNGNATQKKEGTKTIIKKKMTVDTKKINQSWRFDLLVVAFMFLLFLLGKSTNLFLKSSKAEGRN